MEMGLGLSKQTWRMEAREQEPAQTHTHARTCTHLQPRAAIHRKRDTLIGQERSSMASKTPLMPRERVVPSTEVCFIYGRITVYSIHSVERTPVAMTCSQLMSSPFKAITKAEVLAHQSGGMDISSSRCHVKAIFFIIDAT